MSKLSKPNFKRKSWYLNDDDKQFFVVKASLDTFVKHDLEMFGKSYVSGMTIENCVKTMFDRFEWFISLPERRENLKDRHNNLSFLAEILDDYITRELGIDNLCVHFDGTVTWV